jgi:hypothetical protein
MDIPKLEGKLKKLQGSLDQLVSSGYVDNLMQIVRRPGFTSPPEERLVHALVDSLQQQYATIENTHRLLADAAEAIAPAKT